MSKNNEPKVPLVKFKKVSNGIDVFKVDEVEMGMMGSSITINGVTYDFKGQNSELVSKGIIEEVLNYPEKIKVIVLDKLGNVIAKNYF